MSVPIHLQHSKMECAPDELSVFAQQHRANGVYFVDDAKRCNNSIRADGDVFINARCTYWANMIPPPFCCRDASEAILLRFLHEIAHVNYAHCGDTGVVSTVQGLSIDRNEDFFAGNFTGQEGEAWRFAIRLRIDNADTYCLLHSACRDWMVPHKYDNPDWEYSADAQWKRMRGRELSKEEFNLPDWVERLFM